ncbi:MAG: class I SAM-dependent methyltransferase [Verrucomicrobiota bacterium]|nr:class I SAM-dependent methyltransferase [Verrucomicrobiota bacterium]
MDAEAVRTMLPSSGTRAKLHLSLFDLPPRQTKGSRKPAMRLIHKLKKLADPRLLRSIRQHTGRFLLTRRFVFRLDPERIIAGIDRQQFQAIRERHGVPEPGDAPEKYLELRRWVEANIRRVRALELDFGLRRRVLDIGCGAGYFLYICKWLGHDVLGLDLDESPMFADLTKLLGVRRVIWRIERYVPLPDLGAAFDVVTAHMICFNDHKTDHVWGPAEWEFFLDDLRQHVRSGGRIHLEFNREFDGTWYTAELRDYFASRGAIIDQHRVTLTADALAQPAARLARNSMRSA